MVLAAQALPRALEPLLDQVLQVVGDGGREVEASGRVRDAVGQLGPELPQPLLGPGGQVERHRELAVEGEAGGVGLRGRLGRLRQGGLAR